MCGITGFFNFNTPKPNIELVKLNDGISHRGPDDEGFFTLDYEKRKNFYLGNSSASRLFGDYKNINEFKDQKSIIGLGHRRFSIIDTSTRGHQPMEDSGNIIVFNGEVYNFIELKKELRAKFGYEFKTDTDTEVILKSYKAWGTKCFEKFNGFWAIAIFDSNRQELILSRDRFGQKPLYYINNEGGFYFSSEIRPLLNHLPEIKINASAAYNYLIHDRRDAFQPSLFHGVKDISKGTYRVVNINTGKYEDHSYWSYPKVENLNRSIADLTEEMDYLIKKSVELRLRCDVPFEANLSGGLDSGAIVAYASSILKDKGQKLTTHTFDYKNNTSLSETDGAAIIAKHCNTNHNVIEFDADGTWEKLNDLIFNIEEPVHSMASYVQWLGWNKIAKDGYKVILHGSANDELMLGYSHLAQIEDIHRIRKLNFPSKMQSDSIFYNKNIGRLVKWGLKGKYWEGNFVNKDYHPNLAPFNKEFLNDNIDNYNMVSKTITNANSGDLRKLEDFKSLRIPYWNNFMDKSMMSIPMEVRSPFLDVDLVEFCFKVSSSFHYRKGYTKYLLRKSIDNKLPKEIVWNKRKKGFTVPKDEWLKGKSHFYNEVFENEKLKEILNLDEFRNNFDELNVDLKWRIINFSKWLDIFNVKIV